MLNFCGWCDVKGGDGLMGGMICAVDGSVLELEVTMDDEIRYASELSDNPAMAA